MLSNHFSLIAAVSPNHQQWRYYYNRCCCSMLLLLLRFTKIILLFVVVLLILFDMTTTTAYHNTVPLIQKTPTTITTITSSSSRMKFEIQRSSIHCTSKVTLPTRTTTSTSSSSSMRRATSTSTSTTDESSSDNENNNSNPWFNHDIYQRIFYRYSSGSDILLHDAIIIEERCRFIMDPIRPDYMIPTGPRTIILRNGYNLNFDHGEIGNDFYTINLISSSSSSSLSSSSSVSNTNNIDDSVTTTTHNGAGNDSSVQCAIACAIYLACNPQLCSSGRVLEVSANTGLGSLLGCIGAGYVLQKQKEENVESSDNTKEDIMDDILTIGKDRTGPFPPDLELLSITDIDEQHVSHIMSNLRASGLKGGASKVNVDVLDWRTKRPTSQHRINRASSSNHLEYRTVVAADIVFSYPETKELARTVANRVESITPYLYQTTESPSKTTLPCFVHVCPDDREDVTYLRRIFEKGYRMSVTNQFLKLEKLSFQLQKLPIGSSESLLDDMELELKDCKEIQYQALIAQHHPNYNGGGSGELFFPIATGEYDATGGTTFLEKDTGSSPW